VVDVSCVVHYLSSRCTSFSQVPDKNPASSRNLDEKRVFSANGAAGIMFHRSRLSASKVVSERVV
jgi:hypothetical protein